MIQLEVRYPSSSPSTELLSLASSVPIGSEGLVHVVGRNDMAIPMTMGCTWIVKDPDGDVVEEHTDDWAGWPRPTDVEPHDPQDPDSGTHEFISFTPFDLNKEGIYTIAVGLWMNSASPVMVDSYDGALCDTTVEVPPVPPEKKKFPWTPVIIGTGAVIAVAGLAAAKRR